MSTAQTAAVEQLHNIYKAATEGSTQQKAAITALGRAGGTTAITILSAIFRSATAGSDKQKLAIEALGEAGRG